MGVEAESRRLYRLQVALGAAGLLLCVAALTVAARSVQVEPAGAHHITVAGLRFTYPEMDAAGIVVLALAALGAAVLLAAMRATVAHVRAHRRLIRRLPVLGALPGYPAVRVVDLPTPMAFCAGWLRPRVYVSVGVLRRLDEAELAAVLAHEHDHRALRDPLRLALGAVLSQALFFLPVLRPLHERYGDVAELRADAAARGALDGAAGPLASAMLVFGTSPSGGVAGISPERVDSLLGLTTSWRAPRLALIAGLLTLAALVAVVWRAGGAASAHATLNLPVASSQPCLLVLALVPLVACLAGALTRRA
ncbi:MAG TPA: M56 family metallopeptidase [Baekduia sp.]